MLKIRQTIKAFLVQSVALADNYLGISLVSLIYA